jgi:hypothetical protein
LLGGFDEGSPIYSPRPYLFLASGRLHRRGCDHRPSTVQVLPGRGTRKHLPSDLLSVIELFAKQNSLSIADGIGSGAGWKFVTNQRKIEPMFAIQTDMSTSLLTALSDDTAAQFTRAGATIISRSGDPASGFHFSYKDGTSVGSVTFLPLSDQARSSLNSPLGERVKEVRANIVISEKWFAQDSDAVQASKELQAPECPVVRHATNCRSPCRNGSNA